MREYANMILNYEKKAVKYVFILSNVIYIYISIPYILEYKKRNENGFVA